MIFYLSSMCHSCQWKALKLASDCRDHHIPSGALIAPSRNLIQYGVLGAREQLKRTNPREISKLAQQCGLIAPFQFEAPSLVNHCLPMSLGFIKKFRENHSVNEAASSMSAGADKWCAKISMEYDALWKEKRRSLHHLNPRNAVDEDPFLSNLRRFTAARFHLSFDKQLTLQMQVFEMIDYLKNQLSQGEYLIKLSNHVIALVKQEGRLYLFDANQGTIDLTKNCDQWLKEFLEKYSIDFSEALCLFRISELTDPFDQEEVTVLSKVKEGPKLDEEKISERWTRLKFFFRGKTYNYIRDEQTHLIYNDNSIRLLCFKFCLLTPRNMIDASVRTIYHIAMTVINLLKLPFASLKGREQALDCLGRVIRSALDIFRAPTYGLICTLVSLCGIFKPYKGRALYGFLERCLNRQNNDLVDWSSKYYVAPCFVPLNVNLENLTDEDKTINILKRCAIKKEVVEK